MRNDPYEQFKTALKEYGFEEKLVSPPMFQDFVNYEEITLFSPNSKTLSVAEGSAVTDASSYDLSHPRISSYEDNFSSIGAKGYFTSEYSVKLQLVRLKSRDSNKAEKEVHEASLHDVPTETHSFLDSGTAEGKLQKRYPERSIRQVPREDKKVRLIDSLIRAARAYFESSKKD